MNCDIPPSGHHLSCGARWSATASSTATRRCATYSQVNHKVRNYFCSDDFGNLYLNSNLHRPQMLPTSKMRPEPDGQRPPAERKFSKFLIFPLS